MHDRTASGEERIAAFLTGRLRPALYPQRLPMDIGAWHIPGEPVAAQVALRADYTPFAVGETWGRPWATTWFRMHATVPERWAGRRVEALVDLGSGAAPDLARGLAPDFAPDIQPDFASVFASDFAPRAASDPRAGTPGGRAEGLVHDEHGIPLQGLHPHLCAVPVATRAAGGEPVRLLVEAAANPAIVGRPGTAGGAGSRYGDPATAGDTPLYRLRRADLAIRDEDVWQLIHDVEALGGLMRALPDVLPRRHEIRAALEQAVDAVDPRAVARTAARARDILAPVLRRHAHDSAHTLAVVGHAPAGPAWLWPLRETVRRCARNFSTMAALTEEYPGAVVTASGAQHYAWMREHHPHVFERIRKAVADGNWAPAGAMWVEADAELPGGEALVRQFVHGRGFFRDELGADADVVWLPDATGASAAFPQLAALAGARWLLARRPDADRAAAPPHHTFRWEGIDGTRLFTHLAPAAGDATLTGGELADAVGSFADKGAAGSSLLPFGRGDGGPDRAMLERARRFADLEGAPKVAARAPAAFFRAAEQEYPHAPVWRGELDLADRRGSLAGQARTKRGNRRSEALLHEAELWSATAAVRHHVPYPYEELDRLWKQVLLQQCHGILPGTSIAWVHEEAEQTHRDVRRRLERLIRRAAGDPDGAGALNPGPIERREVVVLDPGTGPAAGGQPLTGGRTAVLAQAPALGAGRAGLPLGDVPPVTALSRPDGSHVLDNGLLRVVVGPAGLVTSAVDARTGREAIAPGEGGNLLQLHRDDIAGRGAGHLDPHDRRDLDTAAAVELRERGPLLAAVRVARGTGRSTVVQHLTLGAGSHALTVDTEIDWREQDTMLTLAWPLDVHAEHTTAETQFGHVTRPTHHNTGAAARREHVAHRWLHVGEHGWGVALACDAGHGYAAARHTRADGGTTTVVRSTLLRAPHGPDPHADRGPQHFRHALRPGATLGDAVSEGYALGLPLRPGPDADVPPLVAVDHPDVLIETVKLAEDRSGDVVVRLYESRGGRARTTVTASFPVAAVQETDLLESPLAAHRPDRPLTLRPFQILTLRITPEDPCRA